MASPPGTMDLPLANRYQAAWNEHAHRIAQRQAVIQMYLAAAGVVYGFWFANITTKPVMIQVVPVPASQAPVAQLVPQSLPAEIRHDIDTFLVVAITALTVSSSALIWMHNRVMQKLTNFMKDCEVCASDSIQTCGHFHNVNLFYFYDFDDWQKDQTRPRRVQDFHRDQRFRHRVVLYGILAVINFAALVLTRKTLDPLILIICFSGGLAAIIVPFLDLKLDRGIN